MNFKIIKSKEFILEDKTKGTNYTVAYKGRVLQASSLHFEDKELVVKDGVLTISGDVEIVKKPYLDKLTGEPVMGLSVMPKLGLLLSEV